MTNVQQVRAKAPNKVVNLPSPYSGVSATRHGSVGVDTDLTAISTLISGNQLEVVPDPDAPLAGPDYAAQEFVTHEELEAALSGLGGGGSSFAHLAEGSDWVTVDANNDSPLNGFAVVGGTGTADDPLSDDYTDVNPGSVTIARAASQRALALKSKTDAQPSITFDTDGTIHWGDGTAAPDTTLERLDGATLALTGGGQAPDLVIGGSSADVESYWNGDGTGVVTDFGSANIYLQQSDAEQVVFGVHVSGEAQNRYHQKSDGSLHWGDGTAAPDASLSRLAVGVLGLEATGLVIGAADNYWNGDSTQPTTDLSTPGLIVLANSGGAYSAIGTAAQGILDIRGNGNGIRLHSPNGTAYNITVANDGTVTSTAA